MIYLSYIEKYKYKAIYLKVFNLFKAWFPGSKG